MTSCEYNFFLIGGGLFEGGLFDETPMQVPAVEQSVVQDTLPMPQPDSDDDDDRFAGAPSPAGHR